MTKLEYAVMESERAGEIDIETRNELLSILEAAENEAGEVETETTDDDVMEAVDDLRLRVFEAYENGSISEDDKNTFLEYLNPENYD